MSGGTALQALISGISVGVVYGLVALGFTLVYRLTRVYAFAHGDIVVGSVFVSVLAIVGSAPIARAPSVASSVGLAVLVPAVGGVLSAAIYVIAIRPYRHQPIGWVVGGIAAGLVIREVLGLVFTHQAYAIPDPLHLSVTSSGVVRLAGGGSVSEHTLLVLGIGAVIAVAADLVVERGRLGRALRATSDDAEAAALLGVPVERVVLIAFLLAGVLAGVGGLLEAPSPGQSLSVDAGVVLGLKAVTAAFIGGLGSLRGAIVGGLIVGVIEQYAVAWSHLGASYANVVPLALLLSVIALRPEGLRRRLVEPVL